MLSGRCILATKSNKGGQKHMTINEVKEFIKALKAAGCKTMLDAMAILYRD